MTQATRAAYVEPEMEKLSELRARTDRQVLDFIHSKLDVALDFAVLAETELSAGDRAAAQESLGRAERAFNEAQKLLLAINEHYRRGLARKLNETSGVLARVCRSRELVRPLFFIA